jgi:hypothetical protein
MTAALSGTSASGRGAGEGFCRWRGKQRSPDHQERHHTACDKRELRCGGDLQKQHDNGRRQGRVHGGDESRCVDQEVQQQPRSCGVVKHIGALFVIVVACGEVGLQAWCDRQIRAPKAIHGQHELELFGVDLHQADVRGDAERSSTTRMRTLDCRAGDCRLRMASAVPKFEGIAARCARFKLTVAPVVPPIVAGER